MQMLVNDLTGVTGVIYASNASKVDQQMVRGLGGDHNRLVIIADNKGTSSPGPFLRGSTTKNLFLS